MRIVVCCKAVPEVTDADLEIEDGELDTEDLVFSMNEWDAHAVEAAVRLKEGHGGHVTVVGLGDEETENVVRRALAMGCDAGVLVDGEEFEGSDAAGIARGLAAAIGDLPFDLALCGAQSGDDGWGAVGPLLAARLGLPFAALALEISVGDGLLTVHRELEANRVEVVEVDLPALVTVQTGTDQPRYVSVLGIRKARRLPLRETDADDLDLEPDQFGAAASSVASVQRSLPEPGAGAEILSGSLGDVCARAAVRIRAGLAGGAP